MTASDRIHSLLTDVVGEVKGDDVGADGDPDVDELLGAYGRNERVRGVALAFRAAQETDTDDGDTDGTPATPRGRLRAAWAILRGRAPVVDEGGSDGADGGQDAGGTPLEDLAELTQGLDDDLEARGERLQDTLAEQLDRDDDLHYYQ